MDLREERGRIISESCTITKQGKLWRVPSQSGNGVYSVNPERNYCSCPDNAELGVICKHVHAVNFTLTRTVKDADGYADPDLHRISRTEIEVSVDVPGAGSYEVYYLAPSE